jgi:hypothetical protein
MKPFSHSPNFIPTPELSFAKPFFYSQNLFKIHRTNLLGSNNVLI